MLTLFMMLGIVLLLQSQLSEWQSMQSLVQIKKIRFEILQDAGKHFHVYDLIVDLSLFENLKLQRNGFPLIPLSLVYSPYRAKNLYFPKLS